MMNKLEIITIDIKDDKEDSIIETYHGTSEAVIDGNQSNNYSQTDLGVQFPSRYYENARTFLKRETAETIEEIFNIRDNNNMLIKIIPTTVLDAGTMDAITMIRKENCELVEKLNFANARLNRLIGNRRAAEEEMHIVQCQYENLLRDYHETMQERSNVLEENNRLTDERDFLREKFILLVSIIKKLSSKFDLRTLNQSASMCSLQDGTRLCDELERLNTLCTSSENNDAVSVSLNTLNNLTESLERREYQGDVDRQKGEVDDEPLFNMWHSLTIQLHSKSVGQNIGIILGGGKSNDDVTRRIPLFVKDVVCESPLDGHIRKFDHMVSVNDINVSDMDQRSVQEIFCNSRNLKIVVKRRNLSCRVKEINMRGSAVELGAEFENGVYISGLHENCMGIESGLLIGRRIVYINGTPVYTSSQAEKLIEEQTGDVRIGVALPTSQQSVRRVPLKNTMNLSLDNKQHSGFLNKMQDKLFGRSGTEKFRPIIARANLDACVGDLMSCRHGSLRIPPSRVSSMNQAFSRTGSLRAASYTGDQRQIKIGEQLEKASHRRSPLGNQARSLNAAFSKRSDQREWIGNEYTVHTPPNNINPISTTHFLKSSRKSIVSPSESGKLNVSSVTNSNGSSTVNISGHVLPQSKSRSIARAQRVNTRSPVVPQPPPYPGRRSSGEMSVHSSSSHLIAISSSTSFQQNCSPTKSVLRESDSETLTNEACGSTGLFKVNEVETKNNSLIFDDLSNAAVVYSSDNYINRKCYANRYEHTVNAATSDVKSVEKLKPVSSLHATKSNAKLLSGFSYNSSLRHVKVGRTNIRLCGGNICGILVASSSSDKIKMGERILEIDGYDVQDATLEEATLIIESSPSENVELILEYDGGERFEQVKAGADCDGFYMKTNFDRIGENSDELDLKKGEILYVDNTLFMGVPGRWRAWKLDHEGRQRHCGLILSQRKADEWSHMRRVKVKVNGEIRPRSVYERVERFNSSQKRPVVLISAYLAPFMQVLIEEHGNRFVQCVAECRASSSSEMDQWIEVRKREELFEMLSVNVMRKIINQGYHCILDVTPQAILRLHSFRFYPIIIRIKFKSVKQLKELAEHGCQDRMSSKTAKDLLERALVFDADLDKLDCTVSTINVGAQYGRNTVRYICQQIVAIVEHEQKRTVWMPAVTKLI